MRTGDEANEWGRRIKAASLSGVLALALIMLLALLCAAFVMSGVLPEGAIPVISKALVAVGGFAGGIISVRAAGTKTMISALMAAFVLLLFLLVGRALLFIDSEANIIIIGACVLIGALAAGLLGGRSGKRRKK